VLHRVGEDLVEVLRGGIFADQRLDLGVVEQRRPYLVAL
jgi:hypothetical protein